MGWYTGAEGIKVKIGKYKILRENISWLKPSLKSNVVNENSDDEWFYTLVAVYYLTCMHSYTKEEQLQRLCRHFNKTICHRCS